MGLSDDDVAFLTANHSAAMVTVGDDGWAKAVRVGVALVDGKLWSSGTEGRKRTARLRRDPRCTLFVFDSPGFGALTFEATVTILDGPDAPDLNVRLFRVMQDAPEGPLAWYGTPLEEEEFLRVMREEDRVVYEFAPERAYGLH